MKGTCHVNANSLLSPGVFIALIVCLTIVYLGHLMHKFYISKANETIDTMIDDITVNQAGVEAHGKRLDAIEEELRKTRSALTNLSVGKMKL